MITNIFGRSNPVNFLICIALLTIVFFLVAFRSYDSLLGASEHIKFFAVLPIMLLSVYLTDFITQKNKINKNDNYAILLFSLLILLIPNVFKHFSVVMSSFFILLAFRKLLSLQSHIQVKQKIFDASFWIAVAAVFEFWAILFIIAVYVSIVVYVSGSFKNWIIPIVGVLAVVVLTVLYAFISDASILDAIITPIDFNFGYLKNMFSSITLGVFLSIFGLLFIFQVVAIGGYLAIVQNSLKIILLFALIGLFVYLVSSNKHNGLLLYSFAPLSIIGSNFINSLHRTWFKEVFILLIIGFGIISFMLY